MQIADYILNALFFIAQTNGAPSLCPLRDSRQFVSSNAPEYTRRERKSNGNWTHIHLVQCERVANGRYTCLRTKYSTRNLALLCSPPPLPSASLNNWKLNCCRVLVLWGNIHYVCWCVNFSTNHSIDECVCVSVYVLAQAPNNSEIAENGSDEYLAACRLCFRATEKWRWKSTWFSDNLKIKINTTKMLRQQRCCQRRSNRSETIFPIQNK